MDEVISKYIDDSDVVLQSLTSDIGAYLIAGIAVIALLWVLGYTVRRMFGWFHEWTTR